jgi:hypothetical protein
MQHGSQFTYQLKEAILVLEAKGQAGQNSIAGDSCGGTMRTWTVEASGRCATKPLRSATAAGYRGLAAINIRARYVYNGHIARQPARTGRNF